MVRFSVLEVNLAQASIQTSLGNSPMLDVSTTDAVPFQLGQKSILSNGGNAGLGRPDANTLVFGAGGHDHFLLNNEANELSRTNRITRRTPRMSSLPWNRTRLAMFHQYQQFQLAVREHQRLARDAVSQAVLVSSARHEVTLILGVRQAQLNDDSTVAAQRTRNSPSTQYRSSRSISAATSPYGARATATRSSNKCHSVSDEIGASSIFEVSRISLTET